MVWLHMCVCTRVCACLVTILYSRTHTRACNRYHFVIFRIFLTFSTFNIDLIGPPRPMSTCYSWNIQFTNIHFWHLSYYRDRQSRVRAKVFNCWCTRSTVDRQVERGRGGQGGRRTSSSGQVLKKEYVSVDSVIQNERKVEELENKKNIQMLTHTHSLALSSSQTRGRKRQTVTQKDTRQAASSSYVSLSEQHSYLRALYYLLTLQRFFSLFTHLMMPDFQMCSLAIHVKFILEHWDTEKNDNACNYDFSKSQYWS